VGARVASISSARHFDAPIMADLRFCMSAMCSIIFDISGVPTDPIIPIAPSLAPMPHGVPDLETLARAVRAL
jgi:hypothetical protein